MLAICSILVSMVGEAAHLLGGLAPQRRGTVLNVRRHRLVGRAMHRPVVLEPLQGLGQHLIAHAADRATDGAEAQGAPSRTMSTSTTQRLVRWRSTSRDGQSTHSRSPRRTFSDSREIGPTCAEHGWDVAAWTRMYVYRSCSVQDLGVLDHVGER